MGGQLDRHLADLAGLDRSGQTCLDQTKAINPADLPPAIPPQYRRCVVESNPLKFRLDALVEESLDAGLHRLQRAVQIGAEHNTGDTLCRLCLEPFICGL